MTWCAITGELVHVSLWAIPFQLPPPAPCGQAFSPNTTQPFSAYTTSIHSTPIHSTADTTFAHPSLLKGGAASACCGPSRDPEHHYPEHHYPLAAPPGGTSRGAGSIMNSAILWHALGRVPFHLHPGPCLSVGVGVGVGVGVRVRAQGTRAFAYPRIHTEFRR